MTNTEKLFFQLAGISSELTLSGKRWYTWSTCGSAKETVVELSYQEIEEMDEHEAERLLNNIDWPE